MEKVYLEWIENTIWIIENDICTLHSGSNIGFPPQFRANVFANSKKFCAPKDCLRKYFTSQIYCVTSLLAKSSMNVCNVCKIQKWSITGWDKKTGLDLFYKTLKLFLQSACSCHTKKRLANFVFFVKIVCSVKNDRNRVFFSILMQIWFSWIEQI